MRVQQVQFLVKIYFFLVLDGCLLKSSHVLLSVLSQRGDRVGRIDISLFLLINPLIPSCGPHLHDLI